MKTVTYNGHTFNDRGDEHIEARYESCGHVGQTIREVLFKAFGVDDMAVVYRIAGALKEAEDEHYYGSVL